MKFTSDDNLTIIHEGDFNEIADLVQNLAGSAPCHITNGIYNRQNLPLRETLVAGFQCMMDRFVSDLANPPALIVAVNSDKSIADFSMAKYSPTYAKRTQFLGDALKLLVPDSEVIFVPYDDETPSWLFSALSRVVNTTSLHKHANYGRGQGFPKMPGAEHFQTTACFPLLNEQTGLYENSTPAGEGPAQIVADLYSENNDMEQAYLSADPVAPKILFRAPLALLVHLGQAEWTPPTPLWSRTPA